MARFRFSKMHGLGNDFVILDSITQSIKLTAGQIRFLADRHRGIGFDQLLLIEAPQNPEADFRYRIFNANGSEVEHCGNGARCFVNFVHQHRLSAKNPISVETQRGIIRLLALENNLVQVNMGVPSFEPSQLPFTPSHAQAHPEPATYSVQIDGKKQSFGIVSVGNPHAVIRVDDVERVAVTALGQALQQHPSFARSVNVGFLQIIDSSQACLRVYERDVGETQACGTGACAAMAYARLRQWLAPQACLKLRGGELEFQLKDPEKDDLYMTGPAQQVYNGSMTITKEDIIE